MSHLRSLLTRFLNSEPRWSDSDRRLALRLNEMVGRLTNEQLGEWMLWQQVFDHPQGKSTVEEIAAIVAREAAKLPADDGELLGQAMLRDPRARVITSTASCRGRHSRRLLPRDP